MDTWMRLEMSYTLYYTTHIYLYTYIYMYIYIYGNFNFEDLWDHWTIKIHQIWVVVHVDPVGIIGVLVGKVC